MLLALSWRCIEVGREFADESVMAGSMRWRRLLGRVERVEVVFSESMFSVVCG